MTYHLEEDEKWLGMLRQVIEKTQATTGGEFALHVGIALGKLADMSAAHSSRIHDLAREARAMSGERNSGGDPTDTLVGHLAAILAGSGDSERDHVAWLAMSQQTREHWYRKAEHVIEIVRRSDVYAADRAGKSPSGIVGLTDIDAVQAQLTRLQHADGEHTRWSGGT